MLLTFLSKLSRQEINLSAVLVSGETPRTKKLTTVRVGCFVTKITNKTGTSKVDPISKAQKAQKTFFEKKLEIFEFFLSENVA